MAAEELRKKAASLAAAKRKLFMGSVVAGLSLPLVVWFSGLSDFFWQKLGASTLNLWVAAAVLVVAYLALLELALMPLAYIGGYLLPHRFGLSRQRLAGWLADWGKASAIGLILGSLMGMGFFFFRVSQPDQWWWIYGGLALGGMAFLDFIAPYVLVPLFYRMEPVKDDGLAGRIVGLSERAGARVRAVCTLDFSRKTVEANAAVIGLGRSRRVVLADTLLSEFEADEVEAVIAHELGHHVHRDTLRLMALHAAVLFAGLGAAHLVGLPWLEHTLGRSGLELAPALPLIALAVQVYYLGLLPLMNACSRRVESEADAFALRIIDRPAAFGRAMLKLASQNLIEERPPRWAEFVLYTHPPIYRRVRMAEALGGE